MASNHNKTLLKDYDKLLSEIEKASILISEQSNTIRMLKAEINDMAGLLAKKDEQMFFARKKCTKLQRKIHNIARKSTQKMCIFLLTHC